MKFLKFKEWIFSSTRLIEGSFLAKVSNNSCSIDSSYSLFSNRENLSGNFWTSPSSKILINYLLILLLVFFTCFSESVVAACTTVNGLYSINDPSTDCYSWNSGNITITNTGTITPSDLTQDSVLTSGSVGTLINNGSIFNNSTGGNLFGIRFQNDAAGLINNGLIQSNIKDTGAVFVRGANLLTFTNAGQITTSSNNDETGSASVFVGSKGGSPGSITNFLNTNNITNATGVAIAVGDYDVGGNYIANLTNSGAISAAVDDIEVFGAGNYITNLNNSDTITSSGVG